ncbi:hypothetical protein ART_3474 [Arthrobacter sp. PAMC 25486]|nr:hypothetical protein ART_3474 [Arthrobacter sp. PAMC 25486]
MNATEVPPSAHLVGSTRRETPELFNVDCWVDMKDSLVGIDFHGAWVVSASNNIRG